MFSQKTKLHRKEKDRKSGDLKTLVIDVTTKCNMSCPHCYASTFKNTEPIELSDLLSTLQYAHELGVSHYVLMGGEPILDRERVESILKNCHPEESFITVTTNGWDMTLATIQWLKDLQVDKISISLDSGLESGHDSNRRKGSYKRVLEAVDNITNEGLIVALDVVVTHQSLYSEGFKKVYDYAINKKIRIDLQIAEPVGNWDGRKDILMTKADVEYIRKLRDESPLTLQGQKSIKRDVFCDPVDHCPAGTDFMHITANGNILPCNFLQFSLGNIKDTNLKIARDALLTNPIFGSTTNPLCLCGEDHSFIDKYIMPYVGITKPLDAYSIFNLPKE
ncbi:MAG: radical SAM protein [Dissulfurispiraceae bacterium]